MLVLELILVEISTDPKCSMGRGGEDDDDELSLFREDRIKDKE